jgi:hypothetical protein
VKKEFKTAARKMGLPLDQAPMNTEFNKRDQKNVTKQPSDSNESLCERTYVTF